MFGAGDEIRTRDLQLGRLELYHLSYSRPHHLSSRDLCKTPPFARLLRQAQISILEIFNIFLRLKFSLSLYSNKIEHFSKVSSLELSAQQDS